MQLRLQYTTNLPEPVSAKLTMSEFVDLLLCSIILSAVFPFYLFAQLMTTVRQIPFRLPSWDATAADQLAAKWTRGTRGGGELRIMITSSDYCKDEQVAYEAMKRFARAICAGECQNLTGLDVELRDYTWVDDDGGKPWEYIMRLPPVVKEYNRGKLWRCFLRHHYGAGRNMQSHLISALATGACPKLRSLNLLPYPCNDSSARAFATALAESKLSNLESLEGGLQLNEHVSALKLTQDCTNQSNNDILGYLREQVITEILAEMLNGNQDLACEMLTYLG